MKFCECMTSKLNLKTSLIHLSHATPTKSCVHPCQLHQIVLCHDSKHHIRVIIVTKGEVQDLLERTLCNEFSSKLIEYVLHLFDSFRTS